MGSTRLPGLTSPFQAGPCQRQSQHQKVPPPGDGNNQPAPPCLRQPGPSCNTLCHQPYAGRVFTTIPYGPESTYSSKHFRLFILGRLRLPLPLSARTCRCCRTLDPLGDHRSACAQSGLLRRRGGPPWNERQLGYALRPERGLSIPSVHRLDHRKIEVVANGFPLWGGCQLAVDTTLVSPLAREGQLRWRNGRYAGAALQDARHKERARCGRSMSFGRSCSRNWGALERRDLRRARQTPALLRRAVSAALLHRWLALLCHAASSVYTASLQGLDSASHTHSGSNFPSINNLIGHFGLRRARPLFPESPIIGLNIFGDWPGKKTVCQPLKCFGGF